MRPNIYLGRVVKLYKRGVTDSHKLATILGVKRSTAINYVARCRRLGWLPRGPRVYAGTLVREVMLEVLGWGRLSPRRLLQEIRDEIGTVDERTFWRVVDRCIKAGEVVRIGRKHLTEAYCSSKAGVRKLTSRERAAPQKHRRA